MLIEHTLKRFANKPGDPDGSFIPLGSVTYHFAPVDEKNKASPQVANVEVEAHQTILLNQKPVVFVPYEEKVAAPIPAPAPAKPRKDQEGKVVTDDAGPLGSGHEDEVVVLPDHPKVKLTAVIGKAIQEMAISVEEWNGMAETARFQAVEETISKARADHEAEVTALKRLQDPSGEHTESFDKTALDGKPLSGEPEDSVTPAKPLSELHLNKLRALGKQYGISGADKLERPALEAALAAYYSPDKQ